MKAFLFDLDNTLYSYDDAHAAAFDALCAFQEVVLSLDRETFRARYDEAMGIQVQRAGENAAAIHNRLIRFQILLEEIGKPVSLAPVLSQRYWSVFLDAVRPYPGLHTCLDALREAGYRVGLGTNMTADYQYAKLERLKVLDRMDFIVTSEEVNVEKPHRGLFEACAKKAGCAAGDCVFVGDNPVHDIQGAAAAGMVPVWLCPDPKVPDLPGVRRICSLAELPGLFRAV